MKKGGYQIVPQNVLCFPLGAKIILDETLVASGGGGTNTACSFALQGLKVAYCGKVGNDKHGQAALEDLKKNKVDTKFCLTDKNRATALSAIISVPDGERTVLIQRGACHFLEEKDIPWNKIKKAKWFYIAPMIGESAEIFGKLVEFAKSNGIKVAVNPGDTQLKMASEKLLPILKQVDVLFLNMEEARILTKILAGDEIVVLQAVKKMTDGLVVITKGKEGSMVVDGENLYEVGVAESSVVEKTGAGDAFCSGFLAGLLQKNNIEYAIQLGTANATSCIQKVGAKNGLLRKGEGVGEGVMVKKFKI
jgi:ribokinase